QAGGAVVVGEDDGGVGHRPGLDVGGVPAGVAPADGPGAGVDRRGPPRPVGHLFDVDDLAAAGEHGEVGDAPVRLDRPAGTGAVERRGGRGGGGPDRGRRPQPAQLGGLAGHHDTGHGDGDDDGGGDDGGAAADGLHGQQN